MKFRFLTILFLAIFAKGYTQQMPEYNQYIINPMIINPAQAGINENTNILLTSRQQWMGFKNSPSTQTLCLNGRSENYGWGSVLINDSWGTMRRIGLQLLYSYHAKLNDKINLSIGLNANISQYSINQKDYKPYDNSDVVLTYNKESVFLPNANTGILIYSDKWFAGLSIENIIQNSLNIASDESYGGNKIARNYLFQGTYKFNLSENIIFAPSALILISQANPLLSKFNATFYYEKNYWAGVNYSSSKNINFYIGFKFKNFILNYTFEHISGKLTNVNSTTHEISLGYVFDRSKGAQKLL